MPVNILDFHITKVSDEYRLGVFRRDNSRPLASAQFNFPRGYPSKFDLGQLDFDVKDMDRMDRIRAFGARLYQKVFTTEVARVWSEHKKASDLAVLCIRIAPEGSELEAVPWETLYDGKEFLAAGVRSTISRLALDIKPLSAPPAVPAPLRLLALFSSPLDLAEQSRLEMEHEQEILLAAINDPAGQGKLRADFEDEAKLEILESSLETPYQILHFSGHGMSPEIGGGLLLEDARGNSRPTSVAEIIEEELGNRAGVARSLHNIGSIQQERGDYEQALEYYQRSLEITEELGNRAGLALSLHQIGIIQQERGDYEQALQYYQRSLEIKEELGNRAGVATSLHQIGIIQQERGDHEQALQYYQRSLKIAEELGNRAGVASSLGQIGRLLTKTGRYAEGFAHLLPALSAFLDLESPNAKIVVNFLKTLRGDWGDQNFDAAWKNATETDVPDWLKS